MALRARALAIVPFTEAFPMTMMNPSLRASHVNAYFMNHQPEEELTNDATSRGHRQQGARGRVGPRPAPRPSVGRTPDDGARCSRGRTPGPGPPKGGLKGGLCPPQLAVTLHSAPRAGSTKANRAAPNLRCTTGRVLVARRTARPGSFHPPPRRRRQIRRFGRSPPTPSPPPAL